MEALHPGDPERIGGYRLTHRLGAGGMGQVFLARTSAARPIVVKVIRSEHLTDDGFRARFAREAEAARTVGGFHTAPIVDADPDADLPWIATAYITGPSLHSHLRRHGRLAPASMRVLAAGLAEGLAAIHGAGLIHRDLKPGNIILADQYFIGPDQTDTNVSVYQGINVEVFGLSLGDEVENTGIALDQLPPTDREAVEQTISANDEADAQARVEHLRNSAGEPAD